MTTTIQLTPHDTLASVLARLETAQDERVLFVVPPELELTLVDLRVLRRQAAICGRAMALITSDARLRSQAGQAGISTFRNETWAQRLGLRRAKARPPDFGRPVGPAEAVAPPGPALFARRSPSGFHPVAFLRSYVRRQSPWWANIWLATMLLLIFGGLLMALATVIPAAEITLVPSSEPVQVTMALKAVQDASADAETGVMPAKALSVQVAGEARVATSGKRSEPSAKATGQVLMVNRTGRTLSIPAGTIVATATGDNMRFSVTEAAELGPNDRTTVPVEAVLPGPTGNVRAGTITQVEGPLSLSLVVANEAPTAGGGSADVGVVTEDDQARLQAELFEQLKQKALELLKERLAPGEFLPPDSVTYLALSPTFTPFVGDVSPDLYLSMSIQAVGLAVDTTTGNEMALARLQATMPPGSRLVADSLRYIPGAIVVEDVADPKTISFNMTAEGTMLHGVDMDTVRTSVLGMNPYQATTTLYQRLQLAQMPEISLGPDWLPLIVPTNLPTLPWRIRVHVDWDTAAALAAGQ